MSELVIVKGSIKVKVGEAVYELSKPSNRQVRDLQKKLQASPEDAIEVNIDFLESLGFPKDVAWDIEPSAFEKILEALLAKKKD